MKTACDVPKYVNTFSGSTPSIEIFLSLTLLSNAIVLSKLLHIALLLQLALSQIFLTYFATFYYVHIVCRFTYVISFNEMPFPALLCANRTIVHQSR